jgi:hypothetical protein
MTPAKLAPREASIVKSMPKPASTRLFPWIAQYHKRMHLVGFQMTDAKGRVINANELPRSARSYADNFPASIS